MSKIQILLANRDAILNTISSYCQQNNRPCPRTHIYSVHGDIAETLKLLATNEDIVGSRGRNGGFMIASEVEKVKENIKTAAKERIKANLASKKDQPKVETSSAAPAQTDSVEVTFDSDDNSNDAEPSIDDTVERMRLAAEQEDTQQDSDEDEEFAAMMRNIAGNISPNAHFPS
jgi:hypothetical protein